jgi:glycerate-2-kinase
MDGITILCGGTDGEDGPTDAAGAFADAAIAAAAEARQLSKTDHLARHDAYHFFEPIGGLFKTGLTQTNVMDLRVFLIAPD